jgi:orotate phosphoribosyltransferase-like protein
MEDVAVEKRFDHEEARRMRTEGIVLRVIAERLAVSITAVRGAVRGIALGPRPERVGNSYRFKADWDKARELRAAGLSHAKIAAEIGVSKQCVTRKLGGGR